MTGKIICPNCKKENTRDVLFCSSCRYPLNVKRLSDYSPDEIKNCLKFLFEVLDSYSGSKCEENEIEEIYHEFMSLDWLRPESALLRTLRCKIMVNLKNNYLKFPLLDLGCGDGLFTSILFGARINKKYDAYENVDLNKVDIYDKHNEIPKDYLIKKGHFNGCGLDIKKSSVLNCRSLGTYNEVKKGDVRKIPFEDETFKSVYASMIDDINKKDLETTFTEVHRVLKKGDYFVFNTPTRYFRDNLYFYNKIKETDNYEKKREFMTYDRGRSEWEPRTEELWNTLFKKTSFKKVDCYYYGNDRTVKFWDVGFRPFFNYLMKTREILKEKETYLEFKKIAVLFLVKYFRTYLEEKQKERKAFSVIIAKKI